jgi:hypothetical protein
MNRQIVSVPLPGRASLEAIGARVAGRSAALPNPLKHPREFTTMF